MCQDKKDIMLINISRRWTFSGRLFATHNRVVETTSAVTVCQLKFIEFQLFLNLEDLGFFLKLGVGFPSFGLQAPEGRQASGTIGFRVSGWTSATSTCSGNDFRIRAHPFSIRSFWGKNCKPPRGIGQFKSYGARNCAFICWHLKPGLLPEPV